ncbi:c-type cytochrome [Croceibacterium aestuarii]|uniref:c-type cytochrome n=1 Tax=Croceibacterium aestuarii TaxID=3064139 RepID=UPI00272EA04B|nr:c-type cytochrome [Croceibacterium sp. D39]
MTSRLAVAAALAFALAACGADNTSDTGPEASSTTVATDAMAVETPAVSASDTPAPGATETPAPTPSPTASASASASASATPTPTKVAAAGPPEAFKQCAVCHSTEPGKTLIGPSLAGIYGEKAGDVPGYKFSDAMKNSGLTWNEATLDRYLTDPKAVVPGTTMALAGIKDAGKRADIIAYLKTL